MTHAEVGPLVRFEGQQGSQADACSAEDRARLLGVGERVAQLGSWEWLPGPDTQLWSDNLYRIFGLEPGGVAPTREFVLERTHPQDRERVARYVEMTRGVAEAPPIEYRIQRVGGGVRYLRSTIIHIEPGSEGPSRIVGAVQDVTDQRMTGRELAAHVAVAEALSDWDCFDESALRLLGALGEACEFVLGVLWVPRGEMLTASVVWSKPGVAVANFESSTLALRLRRGAGLPGRAWGSRQLESLLDAAQEPSDVRREALLRAGLHGGVAIPAVKAGQVLAVLEFCSHEQDLTDRLEQTMAVIGNELGDFFSRRRGQLAPPALTSRELEVLQLAALGHTVPKIAELLGVRSGTAKTHLENVYRKLRVSDRSAAVAHALRSGLID
jgi:DNA-binding CsgD family transcriptional regulator